MVSLSVPNSEPSSSFRVAEAFPVHLRKKPKRCILKELIKHLL